MSRVTEQHLREQFRLEGEEVVRISSGNTLKVRPPSEKQPYTYIYVFVETRKNAAVPYHRLKFFLLHGYLPPRVDHRNGDPANNMAENLRAATNEQNCWNVRKRRAEWSLPRGVIRRGTRYQARYRHRGKTVTVGTFATVEEADRAARAARSLYHGKFAT